MTDTRRLAVNLSKHRPVWLYQGTDEYGVYEVIRFAPEPAGSLRLVKMWKPEAKVIAGE